MVTYETMCVPAVCVCCQKKHLQRCTKAPLLPIPVREAFERIGVDVIRPLKRSRSGNKYIICFTDYLTKWAKAFPICHQKADLIANILVNQIIFRHGAPSVLLGDREKNFLSKIVSQTCRLFRVNKANTTAYIDLRQTDSRRIEWLVSSNT